MGHPRFLRRGLAAFEALFATPALWADFGAHWHAVAAALASEDGVLGYELVNNVLYGNYTLLRAPRSTAHPFSGCTRRCSCTRASAHP